MITVLILSCAALPHPYNYVTDFPQTSSEQDIQYQCSTDVNSQKQRGDNSQTVKSQESVTEMDDDRVCETHKEKETPSPEERDNKSKLFYSSLVFVSVACPGYGRTQLAGDIHSYRILPDNSKHYK